MTTNERISKNGLNKGEVQIIALYIKKKLKKKADTEKLASLRGEEAVKFYEKYYAKAAELSDSEASSLVKETKQNKTLSISQTIGGIDKDKMQTGIKAAELYEKQLSKIGKIDRLVETRLNILARLGIDFDSAFKIANSDELYTQVSNKIWG